MSGLRDNWRIILLVVLALGSTVTLLVPGATVATGDNATAQTNGTNASEGGFTNLQYGIQLDGGSRIRAPIVGITAENVDFNATGSPDISDTNETREVEEALISHLDVDEVDVEARPPTNPSETGTVEVFTRNATHAQLVTALQQEGYDVTQNDVRDGVTRTTREEMVGVLDQRISASALTGVNVQSARSPTGRNYIVIEAPGRDIEDLESIVDDRGIVRLYAVYPASNGTYVRKQVATQADFTSIGDARQTERGGYSVSVSLKDSVADRFTRDMQEVGFTQQTVCTYSPESANGSSVSDPSEQNYGCMVTTLNGEVVFNANVVSGLAEQFQTGRFTDDPTFSMETPEREQARNLELSLKAGQALPAPLDTSPDAAQTTSLEPALADQFKINSLITGIIAVIAVSIVVYLRYGDPRVAVPMIVTALSEVLLLLGFVSVIQFPINLSHIAGFIAVIGTGVDDLIIIADEILQREGVATGRVFQNRFRKAFWVIGAAAATTIIAMSPLTVLGLGDLTGFAIITIVGVLIGVLITRPAYGDILRRLVLDDEERSE
ncbi:preprotein translocase subunit SecD [Halomicrobium sp. LC1Hm]|uniref:preprotein translocase subunit SecD n=1 Tax=Halomicrobium sp. LC1Hm TaxID=2610902 RepID=UPI00129835CE|nr:preprotein translocase subunit SecD [Halomicrobium sp. LC1Hm]QGA81605.1 Preprotein translocase subunit SecD [Halomicrobium sp. LC1Hm]